MSNTNKISSAASASATNNNSNNNPKSNVNFNNPVILKHFDIDKNDKTKFICKLCIKLTEVASSGSTGNLHKHLKRKHSATYDGLVKQQKLSNLSTSQPKTSNPVHMNDVNPFSLAAKNSSITKAEVKNLVSDYIIEEMLPLSTVEKPSFKKLVSGLSGRKCSAPCRQTIKNAIEERRETFVTTFKETLKTIDHVCTTADIWSSNNKSFMGMTCHYLDNNYNRVSCVLACRRMKFRHTNVEIAKVLSDVHSEYGLDIKRISGTVTDNASNFGKAFRIYCSTTDENEDADFLHQDDVDVPPMPQLSAFFEDEEDIILPQHYTCASHSLNLLATTDSSNALKDVSYKKLYHSSLGKLTALWNNIHRSTQAADAMEKNLGAKLIVPCPTRWNSLYDSIKRCLDHKERLPNLFEELKLPKLKMIEWEFLNELCSVNEIIAKSIDILQGENGMYLGYLLPTLFLIETTLKNLTHLSYCEPLQQALLIGLKKRFGSIMDLLKIDSKPFILATISLPKFKLKWLPETWQQHKGNLIKVFTDEICATHNETTESTTEDEEDDPFKILTMGVSSDEARVESELDINDNIKNNVNIEILSYLDDKSKDIKMLDRYQRIRKIFYKFNTVLPSSAPVERLFSVGGLILTPRRNRLKDKLFEDLLILKGAIQISPSYTSYF